MKPLFFISNPSAITADRARPFNSTGAARKSLSDDLREVRIRLSIIRSRKRRGVYAGQDVNFVSLLDLQTDARNLGFDLSSNRN